MIEGDFLTLTRGAAWPAHRSRAIPGAVCCCSKPTGAVPHKGGKRFDADSLEYRVLSEWIAAGTPGPKADEPRIDRIEILPEHAVLKPDTTQQLTVRAHFTDGHAEDVTRWAKYTSANDSVARSTSDGNGEDRRLRRRRDHGLVSEPHRASPRSPFRSRTRLRADVFAKAKRRNFIDDLVLEKLQSLNLPPSPRCTDAEFIRRAFIDTIGVLPTAQETRDFLADKSPTETGPS